MKLSENINVLEIFASDVFTSKVMRKYLSKDKCNKLKEIIDNKLELDNELAKDIAEAMKYWAVDNGATHYTHWFVPLNGVTAEKHNSFLRPSDNGDAILDFPIESLIAEESDASSFPSRRT